MSGRFQYKGFCTASHLEDALKYAPDAVDDYHADYMAVLSNPRLLAGFNSKIRVVFFNRVLAGISKEEAKFVNASTSKMGKHAAKGWKEAHDEHHSDEAEAIKHDVAEINAYKNGVKRKQSDDCGLDQLEGFVKPDAKPTIDAGERRRAMPRRVRRRVVIDSDSDDEPVAPRFLALPAPGAHVVIEEIDEEVPAPHHQPVHVEEVPSPHHQPVYDAEVHYFNDVVAHAAALPLPVDDEEEMDWD